MFSLTAIRRFIRVTLGVYLLAGIPLPAYAQGGFSSGSTGADGAFSPTTSQTIQVPESGVFNYTTVNIPSNVTITYVRNAKNTPVTILASGNVTINGVILLSGVDGGANGGGGLGGPGGFNGGAGGFGFAGDVAGFGTAPFVGVTADGPGGGGGGGSVNGADISGGGGGGYALPGTNGGRASVNAVAGQGGPRYGATTLLPLIGGSGGGGGGAITGQHGGAGGGGGGAILIASSTTITMTGTIQSVGGNGNTHSSSSGGGGGAGAGGAIRLVANTITGAGVINVRGGVGGGSPNTGAPGGAGAPGIVRIEAFDLTAFNPNVLTNSHTFGQPNPVTIPASPQLKIASVAGVPAPASPAGSLIGTPDIVLPSSQSNPVTVALEAANVPVGTVVQVAVIPANGTRASVQSSPLAGTPASSAATASVTLPNGTSVLIATAVVEISSGAQAMFVDGERVNRIEIAATYGGASEVTYVTQSGRRVKKAE